MSLELPPFYADDALEKEQKIVLKPQPQGVEAVRAEIAMMLEQLGVTDFELDPPAKGFLPKDLSEEQRNSLNEALAIPYASRNLADRSIILTQPIHENSEEVVHLPTFFKQHNVHVAFSQTTFHEACEEYAGQQRIMYMRRSSAEKFAQAFKALRVLNLFPFVQDCWRPVQVQRGLYRRRIQGIARTSDWSPETIEKIASSFTANMPGLAGHMAASALDWSILGGGTLLDVGNEYPEGKPVSSLDFPYVTFAQWRVRKIFEILMRAAGLKLLKTENWHASCGDRGMGLDQSITPSNVIHGPIKNFDRKTGAIVLYPKDEIDVPFYTLQEIARHVEQARSAA